MITCFRNKSSKNKNEIYRIALSDFITTCLVEDDEIILARKHYGLSHSALDEDSKSFHASMYSKIKGCLPVAAFCLFKSPTGHHISNIDKDSLKYMIIDIDHIDEDTVRDVQDKLKAYTGIRFAFLSPSGVGLKVLLQISGLTLNNYRGVFDQVVLWFKRELGITVDTSGSNPNRLCFKTYDPCGYYKLGTDTFNQYIDITSACNRETGQRERGIRVPREHDSTERRLTPIPGLKEKYGKSYLKEDIIAYVKEVLKSIEFNSKDGTGRNTKMFHEVVRRAIMYRMPPGTLEEAIEEHFQAEYPELMNWLHNSLNLKSVIQRNVACAPRNVVFNSERYNKKTFTYNSIINVEKYVSEKLEQLSEKIDENFKTFICAPTGSGKTSAILTYILGKLKYLEHGLDTYVSKQNIILFPNVITARNIFEEYKHNADVPQSIRNRLALVTGDHPISHNSEALVDGKESIIFAVVDQLPNIINKLKHLKSAIEGIEFGDIKYSDLFKLTVIDEVHKMEGDTSFRDIIKHTSEIFENDVKAVFITATPTEGFLQFCEEMKYETCLIEARKKQSYKITYTQQYTAVSIALRIIAALKRKRKVIARFNSKNILSRVDKVLRNEFKANPINILILQSETKKEEGHIEFAESGEMIADVILCTSILEDGFSIITPGEYTIIFQSSNTEILNPRSVKQMAARCRAPEHIEIEIFSKLKTSKQIDNFAFQACLDEELELAYKLYKYQRFDFLNKEKTNISFRPFSRIFSSRFNRNGQINIFKILNEVSKKQLLFNYRNDDILNRINELFETTAYPFEIGITKEELTQDAIESKLFVKESKQKDLIVFEKMKDIQVFNDLFTLNRSLKGYKNLILNREDCNKKEVCIENLKQKGMEKKIFHDKSVTNVLSIYNSLYTNTENHEGKMEFVGKFITEKKYSDFSVLRSLLLLECDSIWSNSEPISLDLAVDSIYYDEMKEFIAENNGDFNSRNFIQKMNEKYGENVALNKKDKGVNMFFNILFKGKKVRERKGVENPIRIVADSKVKSKDDLISEFNISDLIKKEVFNEIEGGTGYKEKINELKEFIKKGQVGIELKNENDFFLKRYGHKKIDILTCFGYDPNISKSQYLPF